jgi:hypothetical protein
MIVFMKAEAPLHPPGETEFERFSNLTKRVLSVPYSEIQSQVKAEKKQRARKKEKRAKKLSASPA